MAMPATSKPLNARRTSASICRSSQPDHGGSLQHYSRGRFEGRAVEEWRRRDARDCRVAARLFLRCLDWRVSVADVSEAGAFSVFEGIDRVLTLIEGTEMVLIDADVPRHALARWDSLAFAGETRITAELPHGPTRDFNLMLRRDRVSGSVTVRLDAEALSV